MVGFVGLSVTNGTASVSTLLQRGRPFVRPVKKNVPAPLSQLLAGTVASYTALLPS
jgi:hypothetical protein